MLMNDSIIRGVLQFENDGDAKIISKTYGVYRDLGIIGNTISLDAKTNANINAANTVNINGNISANIISDNCINLSSRNAVYITGTNRVIISLGDSTNNISVNDDKIGISAKNDINISGEKINLQNKYTISTESYGTADPSNDNAVEGQVYFKIIE